MKKILIINDLIAGGGVENVLHTLALYLKDRYKVSIVTLYGRNKQFKKQYPSKIKFYTYKVPFSAPKSNALFKKFYSGALKLKRKYVEFILSKKYDIAISYFEIALLKSSVCEVSDYISELSSLYRKCRRPNAVIELYKYICKKHKGFYFPNSFLTSLSAAYLDIGNKEKALQYAGEVFGKLGAKKDKELERIYFRINTYRD